MAKLKVGDHVNYGPGAAVDFIGTVTKVYPDGQYFDMKTNDGRTVDHLPIKDAVVTNRLVSTNAVVANALAARNVRVSFGDDVKVGDEVFYDGHGRWQGMDGKVTRIISDDRIEVRFKNGEFKVLDTDDVVKNALAARGAVANADYTSKMADDLQRISRNFNDELKEKKESACFLLDMDIGNEIQYVINVCKREIANAENSDDLKKKYVKFIADFEKLNKRLETAKSKIMSVNA